MIYFRCIYIMTQGMWPRRSVKKGILRNAGKRLYALGKSIKNRAKNGLFRSRNVGPKLSAASTEATNEDGPAPINESDNAAAAAAQLDEAKLKAEANAAAAQLEEAKLKAVANANAAAKAKDSADALVDALPLFPVDVPPEVVDMYSKALSLAIKQELNEKKKMLNLANLLRYIIPQKDLLIGQCQAMGGFKVNSELLTLGHPDKIFERLGKISSKNLIALSEYGQLYDKKGKPVDQDQTDDMMKNVILGMGMNKGVEDIFKCRVESKFDDTVFMYKEFETTDTELLFGKGTTKSLTLHKDGYESMSNSKYLKSNGINILNVHLPSNGPGSFEEIGVFLDTCLPSIEELINVIPHVIVGDTNITCLKCYPIPKADSAEQANSQEKHVASFVNLQTRAKIMSEMVKATKKKYTCEWALLMSTTYVDKYRSDGIMLNQQPTKTVNKGNPEPDGTSIFIRVPDGVVLTDAVFQGFGTNWILLCDNKFYMSWKQTPHTLEELTEHVTKPEPVKFLKFDKEIQECLNGKNQLLDSLFIDHTPVQISFESLNVMIPPPNVTPTNVTPTNVTPKSWNNLIVLNAGSIVNSLLKWDLNKLNCMQDIQKIDEDLYNKMRALYNPKDPGDYDKIDGTTYGNLMITEENTPVLAELFAEADVKLSKLTCFSPKPPATALNTPPPANAPPPAIKGGRYIKKSKRKSKGKIKIKTKTKRVYK